MKNLILLSILLLTSCSLLSPVKTCPPNIYTLNSVVCDALAKKTRPVSVLVTLPEVDSAFNTTQMAFEERPYQIGYYSLNRWSGTPAQMLHPLLIQSLQNSHYFHAVLSPPCIGHYDYILCTHIYELLQNYSCHPPVLQFSVRVQIIQATTAKVIATDQFFVEEPIAEIDPYAGVIAANCATGELLNEIVLFSMHHMK